MGDGGWSAQSSSSDSSGLQKDAAHTFFTDQMTLQTKDIEFENSQVRAAVVEATVNQLMMKFRDCKPPIVPVNFWKKSQPWVARVKSLIIKKAKPETGAAIVADK